MAYKVPPGNSRALTPADGSLHFVTAEEIVLVARRAIGAAQAAHQKHCHPYSDEDGDQISVRREPMNCVVHIQDTHSICKLFRRWTEHGSIRSSIGTPKIPATSSYHRQNSSVIQ